MDPLVREESVGESDGCRQADEEPLQRDSDFSELECSSLLFPAGGCGEHELGMVHPLSAPDTQPGALLRVGN